MKRYMIVQGNSIEELESNVDGACVKGYTPIGGVSVAPFMNVTSDNCRDISIKYMVEYSQAMTRLFQPTILREVS